MGFRGVIQRKKFETILFSQIFDTNDESFVWRYKEARKIRKKGFKDNLSVMDINFL